MGEKCPESPSHQPEGEEGKQGRLKHVGQKTDCSTGNQSWVQALVDVKMFIGAIGDFQEARSHVCKVTLTSSKTGPVFTTTTAAVEVVVVVMENPRGPMGGGVVVVVVVTDGVTNSHGEGRMKLSPVSPQFAIGCSFQNHM